MASSAPRFLGIAPPPPSCCASRWSPCLAPWRDGDLHGASTPPALARSPVVTKGVFCLLFHRSAVYSRSLGPVVVPGVPQFTRSPMLLSACGVASQPADCSLLYIAPACCLRRELSLSRCACCPPIAPDVHDGCEGRRDVRARRPSLKSRVPFRFFAHQVRCAPHPPLAHRRYKCLYLIHGWWHQPRCAAGPNVQDK